MTKYLITVELPDGESYEIVEVENLSQLRDRLDIFKSESFTRDLIRIYEIKKEFRIKERVRSTWDICD